ncbi:MAG: hypothetical protein ABIV50_07565 [Opitutus sp.]
MHVSNNIIRFPVPPAHSVGHERPNQEPAKVIEFKQPEVNDNDFAALQERGQVFAAHRIVSRVANQLDSIAAL